MRTTLTLDPDVAAGIARVRAGEQSSFKEAVNHLLRLGLQAREQREQPTTPYVTQGVNLGECLVGSIDDVAEVLALTEGEQFG